ARHPVVVVVAGPVGLSLDIDLAQQCVPVVVLENDYRLSSGSLAICFAKRTLEIFDLLGCGDRMVDKGVSWNVGRLYFRNEPIYRFDMLAESGHARPAFINLQQYYVEGFLADRAAQLPLIDLRWKNSVQAVEPQADHVRVTIGTPDGPYTLAAQYLVACDGSRSTVRQAMGLESKGQTFRDRFLIADVKMQAPFPAERWFWFDPPFHPNQSVLLHMQPDNVWRIDFQLGWQADPEEEKKPENIIPRVKALLGDDVAFTLEWASVYTFSCLRMDKFRHGRVMFAGDAAHGVSPFGARGANSGVQDADNLGWKLACVLRGEAGDRLLDSYGSEREYAADENILNSTRATDFITPKTEVSRLFRDAVLDLAKDHPFARTLVNSGRLSVPATLHGSPLNTPDADAFEGRMVPGAAATDAPVRVLSAGASSAAHADSDWLLRHVGGATFTALVFDDAATAQTLAAGLKGGASQGAAVAVVHVVPASAASSTPGVTTLEDVEGHAANRYGAQPGTVYLLRPDQHVFARFRHASPYDVLGALNRALALN
ncbi:MAG: putativev FAD-dependent monooxygenase, partial [Rhizobacter sp.]|nr:putativev FAD-dependent monooxygenase [Rhizobacter sp.]